MKYDWKSFNDKNYFFDVQTGKIIGMVHKYALSEIYYSIAYVGVYTFTIDEEKHLGQYISYESAKKALEHFWSVKDKTLEYDRPYD